MAEPAARSRPDPQAYRRAMLETRKAAGNISSLTASRVRASLGQFTIGIARAFDQVPPGPYRDQLDASLRIVTGAADALSEAWTLAIQNGVDVTYDQVARIWSVAGEEAARVAGIDFASLGRIRAPALTTLAAFQQVGGAAHWRTLLRNHVGDAVGEANAILRGTILEGVGLREVSRRMRRYVEGVEGFEDLFAEVPTMTGTVAKVDLRTVPPEVRGQMGRMLFNADRIAASEIQNARHASAVEEFIRDPLVQAVRWRLSPVRSTSGWSPPDECDVLAGQDFYGLGAGVYPVTGVPGTPHPFDRCELEPVPYDSLGKAFHADGRPRKKPRPDPNVTPIGLDPSFLAGAGVSEDKAIRILGAAERAFQFGRGIFRETPTGVAVNTAKLTAGNPAVAAGAAAADLVEEAIGEMMDVYARFQPAMRRAEEGVRDAKRRLRDLPSGMSLEGDVRFALQHTKGSVQQMKAPRLGEVTDVDPHILSLLKTRVADRVDQTFALGWARGDRKLRRKLMESLGVPEGTDLDALEGHISRYLVTTDVQVKAGVWAKALEDQGALMARVEQLQGRFQRVKELRWEAVNRALGPNRTPNAGVKFDKRFRLKKPKKVDPTKFGGVRVDPHPSGIYWPPGSRKFDYRRAANAREAALREQKWGDQIDHGLRRWREMVDDAFAGSSADPKKMGRFAQVHRIPKNGSQRSFFRDWGGDKAGIHMARRDGIDPTVVHEIGHLMEAENADLGKASLEFLTRRRGGEAATVIYPGEGGWKDKFYTHYVGRDYRGLASEILSMGLEAMYESPLRFLAHDPDHFAYTLRVMNGVVDQSPWMPSAELAARVADWLDANELWFTPYKSRRIGMKNSDLAHRLRLLSMDHEDGRFPFAPEK